MHSLITLEIYDFDTGSPFLLVTTKFEFVLVFLIDSRIAYILGMHTLRHTFATMLFENGCSIKIVSELLGHCDTRVTENTYIHIIQKQKIKAIEDLDKYCV